MKFSDLAQSLNISAYPQQFDSLYEQTAALPPRITRAVLEWIHNFSGFYVPQR